MYSINEIDHRVLTTALAVLEDAEKMIGPADFLLINDWQKWLREKSIELRALAAFVAILDKGGLTSFGLLAATATLLDVMAQAEFAEKQGHIFPLRQLSQQLRRAVEIDDQKILF